MAPVTASEARWEERSPPTAASSSATPPRRSRPRESRRGPNAPRSTVTAKIVAGDRVARRRSSSKASSASTPSARARSGCCGRSSPQHGRRAGERAPVRRDATPVAGDRAAGARPGRVAGLPDGDQRRAARHQPVADRCVAGVRGDPGLRDAPLRQRGGGDLSLRRSSRGSPPPRATGLPRRWRWRTKSIQPLPNARCWRVWSSATRPHRARRRRRAHRPHLRPRVRRRGGHGGA